MIETPIPLSENSTRSTIGHINKDHQREMLLLVHGLTDATWATTAHLDRIYTSGIDLTVTDGKDRTETLFVLFEQDVHTGGASHKAIKTLVGKAREKLQAHNP